MNRFKLIVPLALLTVWAVAVGFAGNARNGGASVPISAPATSVSPFVQRATEPATEGSLIRKGSSSREATSLYAPIETSMPTPVVDRTSSLTSGLSGLYHIPGDFASIGAAVGVLNFVGLMGSVTFQLDTNTYSESAITFGAYPGNDSSVTIRPKAGKAVSVVFGTSSTSGKGFAFNGAKNITIDGVNSGGSSLTLSYSGGTFPSSDAFAATIYVTNGSQNISVKNASIRGNILGGTFATQTDGRPAVFVWRGAADATGNANITIDHCTITNATFGLKVLTKTFGNVQGPISYTYNNVGGAYGALVGHGGIVDEVAGMHYDHNTLDGIEFIPQYWNVGPTEEDHVATFATPNSFLFNFGQPSAGHFYNMDAASTVTYNFVKDAHQNFNDPTFAFIVYGLLVRVGSGPSVHDNRITGVQTTDVDATIVGLRNEAQAVHNSIRLTGSILSTQTAVCMRAAGGSNKNNAFSNELTGAAASKIRALNGTPAGSSDHNAMYSAGQISTQSTLAGYLATGFDPNSVFSSVFFGTDLHIDSTAATSASNIGAGGLTAGADIDGQVRSLTAPDAGADEFPTVGPSTAIDILPYLITSPNQAGVVAGLPYAPVVMVKNNSNQAVGAFSTTFAFSDGYSQTVATPAGIPANGTVTVTFPNWTPAAGTWTETVTTLLSDANAGNNVLSGSITVSAPIAVVDSVFYTWDASDQGWTRTIDFVRSSTFTKLGGPYAGSSMVTNRPTDPTKYTEGARASSQGYATTYPGPNLLISPWLDLSGMAGTDVYISFLHSIETEPGWDGSWIDFTTDGNNWTHLGHLNDPNGTNWFAEAVYANAHSFNMPDNVNYPPDTTTMRIYHLFGPGTGIDVADLGFPFWTSNGDPGLPNGPAESTPTGPTGWIFNQLHITPATYPAVIHAAHIQFRYVAFSDASLAYGGWAVDNFKISRTGAAFAGGTIKGHVFSDLNGNAIDESEPAEAGLQVFKSYFGVRQETTLTNGSGNYTFHTNLPGVYNIQVVKPGYAFSIAPLNGIANVNSNATGDTATQNFGTYLGAIGGVKYSDLNNNGALNGGEPGIAGFVISLHKDSCNGTVTATATTDANGKYKFPALPGTYYLSETQQTGYRKTEPTGNCRTVVLSGVDTTENFGNFKLNNVKLEKVVDLNGNGVKEAGDVTSMPVGAIAVFDLKKNGSHVRFDTLGNLALNKTSVLDTGSYSYEETFVTAGWVRTLPSGSAIIPFSVTTSGVNQTITYMNFKLITLSGSKFEDKNGNGARDTLEPGLPGWTISVHGGLAFGGTSAVTDANGNWSIDSLGGANDTVVETPQAGWSRTKPAAGFYAVPVSSGSNQSGLDFGNFKNVTISGYKYRDRNANGSRNAGEEGLSGWQINITGVGAGSTSTDVNGHYSLPGVGPGSHNLSETPQVGWSVTQPSGGTYTFSPTSGVDDSSRNFGNYRQSDSTKLYRTFTSDEMEDGAQHKATKPAKAGKPYVAPNLQSLLKDYYTQFGQTSTIIVGVPGVLNGGGKVKAYVQPAKYTDVFKSLWVKGITHSTDVDTTEIVRGFDLDNKAKQMLKRFKSLPPTKQKNDTFEELLVLSVNIALSDVGKTPIGLGDLIYDDGIGGALYNGMKVRDIMTAASNVMTNFEFVPLSTYGRLEQVAAKINDAFSCGGVDCETIQPFVFDSASWTGSSKVVIAGLVPVSSVPYIKGNPNAVPTTTPKPAPQSLPKVYALYQNYPNPFNPTTTIEFDLPSDAFVTLRIYNVLGQEMGTLFDHEAMDAGNQDVDFDASALPSGVYFYRLVAQTLDDDGVTTGQTFTLTKKMMLIK